MAEKPMVEFFQAGASSLIKHFCDEIDLVNRINRTVTWDPSQWKVSLGQHVLALVINTLCGRLPLSRVKEFYRKQDVEVLFGEGVKADDFNDDALGRTLDRLHDANPKSMLTSITLESLMTAKDNVLKAHGSELKFISLVSEQHKLREEAIEQALKHPALEEIGPLSDKKDASVYHSQELPTSFHGGHLRLAVVYSSHLFQQKQATYHRQLEKEKQRLQKEIDSISKQEFSCEDDARHAGEAWLKKQKKSPYPIQYHTHAVERPAKRQGRGRPKKTEEVKIETIYTLAIELQPVPKEVIAERERRLGYFVLATNVNDAVLLPTADILREYKQQSTVELRFKFLKDPTFVDALFLNTPERIEALGYLLILCLFIYMTIERRIRLAVQEKKIRLQPMRGQYTRKPTARQIFLMLSAITVMKWYDRDDQSWYREVRMDEEVRRVCELLHFDPDAYTVVFKQDRTTPIP